MVFGSSDPTKQAEKVMAQGESAMRISERHTGANLEPFRNPSPVLTQADAETAQSPRTRTSS